MPSTTLELKTSISEVSQATPIIPSAQSSDQDSEILNLWRLGSTPINTNTLNKYLFRYPNKVIANQLLQGFSKGFKLHYCGPRLPIQCNNLKSAEEHPMELKVQILKEIGMGRIEGPYSDIPISNLRISPIGLVPKGNDSGWRLITHLSFPKDNSVNYFIDPDQTSVQYSIFDSVIQMIAKLGKGAFIGKRDIKSAFRLLQIFPGDFDLLGFQFQGKYYVDKCLPMGCSRSCKKI
jgi:hypothetical protein